MALSPHGTRLYVALNGVNELGVIDTATNQLIRTIPVGNAPRQVVLANHGQDAFVSNEGGRPARPGDFTNHSDGTAIVASKVTGAATTGTVSEINLATGREVRQIRVGLEPTAEYLAPDGTLMVANSNDDTFSLIDTRTARVVQTVNVNPLPGSTVGSYPNAITMPDPGHILVSIGRDNALAVYGYSGPRSPVQVRGPAADRLLPGRCRLRPGHRQGRRHQRQGHRRPRACASRSRRGAGHGAGGRVGHRPLHLRRHRLGHPVRHAGHGRAGRLHPPGVRATTAGITCWPASPCATAPPHPGPSRSASAARPRSSTSS